MDYIDFNLTKIGYFDIFINKYLFEQMSREAQVIIFNQKKGEVIKRSKKSQTKVNDVIYDFIYFQPIVWYIIDTPQFQRLRKIKQLISLEYVYPCATHTRFQHSLGAAHLAKTFMETLIQNNPAHYKHMDENQKKSAIRCVVIAALVHELGQGPFSRAWDYGIVKQFNIDLKVEQATIIIFRDIAEDQYIKDRLKETEIQRIQAIIKGLTRKQRQEWKQFKQQNMDKEHIWDRPWEYQILSNELNGIDVDKFDYFRRDAKHVGATDIYIDHQLLFKEARIIDNQICYPTSIAETITNIFHCRYKLYKIYYFNVTNKAIERMIIDLLKEIKEIFHFQKIIRDLKQKSIVEPFIKLNDNIVDVAEFLHDELAQKQNQLNQKQLRQFQNLKKATEILQRIRRRDIYSFVKELKFEIQTIQDEKFLKKIFGKTQQKQLKQRLIAKNKNLAARQNDIVILISQVGLGLKDKNPMLEVGFFNKEENYQQSYSKIQDQQEIKKLSMLFTNAYKQLSIKFFIKQNNHNLFFQVSQAVNDIFHDLSKEQQLRGKISIGKMKPSPKTKRSQKQVTEKSQSVHFD